MIHTFQILDVVQTTSKFHIITDEILGISPNPKHADYNCFIHYYGVGSYAGSAVRYASCLSFHPRTPPTKSASPNTLWTALSGDEVPLRGRGQR